MNVQAIDSPPDARMGEAVPFTHEHSTALRADEIGMGPSDGDGSGSERFQPRSLTRSPGVLGSLAFAGRCAVDLQTQSIYRLLRQRIPTRNGVLVDIGCGGSPYATLVNQSTAYIGIDVPRASNFGYGVNLAAWFDGDRLPFRNDSIDTVLLTEVLEHVSEPERLLAEVRRILKPGGLAIITTPWSARFHFQPWDYARYSPTKLAQLLHEFEITNLVARGTDWTAIASKVMVVWTRSLLGGPDRSRVSLWRSRAIAALCSPAVALSLGAGHLGIRRHAGSSDDPLGYYIECVKPGR